MDSLIVGGCFGDALSVWGGMEVLGSSFCC